MTETARLCAQGWFPEDDVRDRLNAQRQTELAVLFLSFSCRISFVVVDIDDDDDDDVVVVVDDDDDDVVVVVDDDDEYVARHSCHGWYR